MSKKNEAPKNEVAVKTNNSVEVADFGIDADLLDMLPRAESNDFNIPRLTLIQPTSKIPGNPGEIIDSDSKDVVGKIGEKFMFVPIFFAKDIAISVKGGKWKRNEVKSAANAHLTLFENRVGKDADGEEVERKERLNLFLIKESELSSDFPRVYRMIIKPSSFKEAKKFISEWDIQIRCGQAPFTKVWAVQPALQVDEKGKYATLEFSKVMEGGKQRQVTAAQLVPVKHWVRTLAVKKDDALRDDHGDDDVGEQVAQTPTHSF